MHKHNWTICTGSEAEHIKSYCIYETQKTPSIGVSRQNQESEKASASKRVQAKRRTSGKLT